MKKVSALFGIAVMGAGLAVGTAQADEPASRWVGRFDMGGVISEEATLTEFAGPVSGGTLKLNPGFQMDLSAGYRLTPWLEVGPELGFTFNFVDSIGGWSYPSTTLGQILMMANVRLEYPPRSRLVPFIGGGIGGVASFLTFGGGYSDYDYYYYEPAGTGSNLSLAFQGFAGLRYRLSEKWDVGLEYRYLYTSPQHWDVKWWNGAEFGIGIDSLRMHSICLVFSGKF